MFQPDSLTDVPFEENFKLQFNHHDGLPSNRVGHSGGENLVLCSAGSSIHHHSQCTNDDRSSQLVTPSYNPRTYLKSGDLPSSHHSTVVRNENRTSGNLGSSFDHQTQKSSTASKFCPSQHMYDRSILMQSQNSSSEENGSLNMSIEPSSMTPYRPSVSSTIHNEKGGQNSHTESQNLPVAPHSMHGPYTSVDEQQQHQTEIKSPSRHVHLKEECKPQPVQQQVCHTNIETTSQQSHHHKTCHDIEGNPSSPSVHKPSTTMVHQIRGNFQHNVSPPVVTRRPHPQPTSIQYHDSGPDVQKGRKVFILHYVPDNDVHLSQVILSLAVCLRNMKVDVSIDMFERDKTVDNWSIWYEKEILSSSVVLCIITPNFYSSLTDSDRVRGYSVYNLLNNSKGIAFRAVFLDRQKNMEDVPLSMRGATCYSISSEHLTVNDEEFASLYAFLTGQNRVEKPPLGNMVVLSPRRSKFSQRQNSRHTEPAHASRMIPQHRPPVSQPGMIPQQRPTISQPGTTNKEYFDGVFSCLRNNVTPIKSLGSQQKLFMTMASNLAADWEILGRMLDVSEADVHAIKRDYRESVKEQSVQVLRKWLDANGTKATVAVISTAIYESGSQYWNLLDILYKQTSKFVE